MSAQPQLSETSKKRKNPFLDPLEAKRPKTDADAEDKIAFETINDEKMEENIADFLPSEIFIQIFQVLPSADLANASVTCQAWNRFSKDDSLGWYLIGKKTLTESTDLYKYSKLKAPGKYETLEAARQANITEDLQFDGLMKYLGSEAYNTHYHLIKSCSGIRVVCYHYNVVTDDFNSGTYRFAVGDVKSGYASFNYPLKVEANFRRIERRVQKGEEIGFQSDVLILAAKLFQKKFESKGKRSIYYEKRYDPALSYTPQVQSIVTAQNEQLIGVKLHDYQLRAINWMVSVEQERKQFTFSSLIPIPMTYLLANPLIKNNCLVLPEDAAKHNLTYTVKGGILADEMGLGKSLEVLGLILQRPMTQRPNEKKLFVSKATLVFCPNHLVQQWQDEIEKHSEPKLSVITITTIHHVKKYTPHDLMNVDVVIATYNLLQNKNYLKFPNGDDLELAELNQKRRFARLRDLLEETCQKKNTEKAKGVVLEHFLWHRIVMDEGHEMVKEKSFPMMHKFKATHKWFVTGTPFPKGGDIHDVRRWLELAVPSAKDGKDVYHDVSCGGGANYDNYNYLPRNLVPVEETLINTLMDELLWRNTKKSINTEYEMVSVSEEVKLVQMTPIEKAIYAFYSFPHDDKAMRMCCNMMESEWGKTNEERKQYFITLKKRRIAHYETNLAELEKKHGYYSAKLEKRQKEDPTHTGGLGAANEFERTYPGTKKSLTETLEGHKSVLKTFEDLPEMEEENTEGHTSKLRQLVSYLKDLFERDPLKRVIIFSQYNDFLELIGEQLAENDILTTNLKGNVYRKTNGLNKFKADKSDVKVMLMNFDKTASGTNLIEASHVIFTDPLPLYKSTNEAKAIEAQAIGRAQRQGQTQQVTLVRFIVADSVEVKLYERVAKTQ